MKTLSFSVRLFRQLVMGGLLLTAVGAFAPAKAYDDDDWRSRRWREHERHEHEWRAHERRAHWDHRYWDSDTGVYVYRPPPVYYAPPPPSGLDFVFRFGR